MRSTNSQTVTAQNLKREEGEKEMGLLDTPKTKAELSTTEEVEESSILLENVTAMKALQQGEYLSIQQGCQQLRLEICGVREYKAEKDE